MGSSFYADYDWFCYLVCSFNNSFVHTLEKKFAGRFDRRHKKCKKIMEVLKVTSWRFAFRIKRASREKFLLKTGLFLFVSCAFL